MTPSQVVPFIFNIMIPLTLHFIIFTGFTVEAVVCKVTAGISVHKQALVPSLTGPLPQQVTINQTLVPQDYLRVVFTTWQFEIEMNIVGKDEHCPTKMREALAAMYKRIGVVLGTMEMATAAQVNPPEVFNYAQFTNNEHNIYLGDVVSRRYVHPQQVIPLLQGWLVHPLWQGTCSSQLNHVACIDCV